VAEYFASEAIAERDSPFAVASAVFGELESYFE